jgi:hypothetical protein
VPWGRGSWAELVNTVMLHEMEDGVVD